MKFFTLTSVILLTAFTLSCKNEEEKEPETIVSTVDGEEYASKMNGEMNTFKAAMTVIDGGTFDEDVPYSLLLNFSDSLMIDDSIERSIYFDALNIVLGEFDSTDYNRIKQGMFGYFLHHPKELTTKLNERNGYVVSTWTELLSEALDEAIQDPEVTEKSVINVALKHCTNCSQNDQEFIVSFVESLKSLSDLSK